MKDFRNVSGRKTLDRAAGKEKENQPTARSAMAMDPHYMQKLIGNRAVQFLVESQVFAGAQQHARNTDYLVPEVDYAKEEVRIGEDREALKPRIVREMAKKKGELHALLERAEERQVYVNVTTELDFAIVQSNIETGAYYDKMLLRDVSYSTEDKEYTSQARRESEQSLRVTQGFSFAFDKNEFADLMPDQHVPVEETADSGAVPDTIAENNDMTADADLATPETGSAAKADSVIEEVVEQGKEKLL